VVVSIVAVVAVTVVAMVSMAGRASLRRAVISAAAGAGWFARIDWQPSFARSDDMMNQRRSQRSERLFV
jgi:hypothetical protein